MLQKKAPAKTKRSRPTGRESKKSDANSEDEKQLEDIQMVMETVDDLSKERGDEDKIWGSMVKQTLKRRKPGFRESYHGYRTFKHLLEDARARGLLELDHDQKSGGGISSRPTHAAARRITMVSV